MPCGTDKYNTEIHEFIYGPLVLTATTSSIPINASFFLFSFWSRSASFILLFFIKNIIN